MTYIDLNMVRAGVVKHPLEWNVCGYREIQVPPLRYRVIDQAVLLDVFGFASIEQLKSSCRDWVEGELKTIVSQRDRMWTESLAVGRQSFNEGVKEKHGVKVKHREITENDGVHMLREPLLPYIAHLGPKMMAISGENTVLLE